MGSGIRFLVMDDDMMKMLPKELESKVTWDAIQNEFGSTEIIFIAFGRQGESAYQEKTLADLWTLTEQLNICLLYTSPSPRDRQKSRMPSSA